MVHGVLVERTHVIESRQIGQTVICYLHGGLIIVPATQIVATNMSPSQVIK